MANTINPNEIIPTPANGLLHDLTWGVKKIVDADAAGEESWETIFEGEVTTVMDKDNPFAIGSLDAAPSADSIKVTFNGTEYTCERIDNGYGASYNKATGYDFSDFPFSIYDGSLYTESAGTYSLKIEEPGQSGSSDFSTAEVTLTDDNDSNKVLWAPYIENDQLSDGPVYDRVSVIVPLYKGFILIGYKIIDAVESDIISGNATIENGRFKITGDCNIKYYANR